MLRARLFILLLSVTAMTGCTNVPVNYYVQAIGGQMEIWQRAQPIEALIKDSSTPAALKTKLTAVLEIREFASRELDLPSNGSYRSYADLQRPYVVWNVFATPEFSTKPIEWCFVFTGCVNYRGYFSQQQAIDFAERLQHAGYDVFIGGVPAYSTLGWFNDPVLNTFAQYPETEVAAILFHELAHQIIYLPNDSPFNESFATVVEMEGVRRWLAMHGTPEQRSGFYAAQKRKNDFIELILRYRDLLDRHYAKTLDTAEKRALKKRLLQEMQDRYQLLKSSWGADQDRYDQWFSHELNNAHLASIATYTQFVPAFEALLSEQQADLSRFYQAVIEIAKLPESKRNRYLQSLLDNSAQRRSQPLVATSKHNN